MGRGFESLLDHQRNKRIARNELSVFRIVFSSCFSSFISGGHMELLNNINVILQIISNICIVGITLYTAFLQFWHKSVKYLGYSYNTNRFYGDKATLQLKNQALSSISIKEVYLIFDDNSKFLFKKYEVPLLIEGRRSFQIEMQAISNSLPKLRKFTYEGKCIFVTFTDGNSISLISKCGWKRYISFWVKNYRLFRLLKKSPSITINKLGRITTKRIEFNGKCLSEDVKYVLLVKEVSAVKTIFIDDSGFMSAPCFLSGQWCNALGTVAYDEINNIIKQGFNGQEVEYKLYNIKDVATVHEQF